MYAKGQVLVHGEGLTASGSPAHFHGPQRCIRLICCSFDLQELAYFYKLNKICSKIINEFRRSEGKVKPSSSSCTGKKRKLDRGLRIQKENPNNLPLLKELVTSKIVYFEQKTEKIYITQNLPSTFKPDEV